MVYLVSYDLVQPERNYEKLHNMLSACSNGKFVKPLESVYLISSTLSANKISELIKSVVDTDDKFILFEVNQIYQGYLSSELWLDIQNLFPW